MILNQAENIMLGSTEVQKVNLGEVCIWERVHGLAPYGTNWNLYGVSPCEYQYLLSGIHLKGLSSTGVCMFTCAESPSKIDFTTIKSIGITCESIQHVADSCGGISAIPVTHSLHPQTSIAFAGLQLINFGSTSASFDCRSFGGENFLLMYSDLDSELNVYSLNFEYYPEACTVSLSSAVWERRNFQYESETVLTCTEIVDIPNVSCTELAVHIGMYSGKATKCCVAFMDENNILLGYGDDWQGTTPSGGDVSTHFQEIPEHARKIQVVTGYAPDITETIQVSDLKSCILCFS